MLTPGNTDKVEQVTCSSLVELSVVAPHGQDQIQEDMKNFAEQLKPYPCWACEVQWFVLSAACYFAEHEKICGTCVGHNAGYQHMYYTVW